MPPHLTTRDASPRKGFTLTELLVAVAIILVLMSLIAAAAAAARNSSKINATRATIAKLSQILSQQYASYGSITIVSATTSAQRAAGIRRMITADLPDSWADVAQVASGTNYLLPSITASGTFPNSPAQRAYTSIWKGLQTGTGTVGNTFGDAECLFMIVMRSGIADCLDCGALRTTDIGDQDGDSAPEFLDAWGNPIRFVLWPAGLELPPGSGTKFFSSSVPFMSGTIASAPGGLMRPLIFSAGPDGKGSTAVNDGSYIAMNLDCGNPANAGVAILGGLPAGDVDSRADNITNFDAETK